jgi:hypothetical protein
LDGVGLGALGLRRSWEQKNAKRKQQDWASVGPTGGVWTRRRCGREGEERRRHVDAAVASWAAQGWAIESQTAESAVLRRGREAMLVNVDQSGHVTTRPLPSA